MLAMQFVGRYYKLEPEARREKGLSRQRWTEMKQFSRIIDLYKIKHGCVGDDWQSQVAVIMDNERLGVMSVVRKCSFSKYLNESIKPPSSSKRRRG